MFRSIGVLAAATILVAPLTGCGRAAGTPAQDDMASLAPMEQRGEQCEECKEHWRTGGTAKRGGTFVQANSTPTRAFLLDPTAPGSNTLNEKPQIYERLLRPRACYYEDTTMLPALARSWERSSDGLAWTFKLREGVRWHDKPPVNGRLFGSADVAWTIEHQKQGGNLETFWRGVEHQEPDAQTVVLRLKEVNADFLGLLGEGMNVMVPREVKEHFGDFKNHAIGTGPFMMEEYKPDSLSLLKRNPRWWGGPGEDGQPLPYIEQVEIRKLGDYAAEIAAMRTGQLDLNGSQGFNKRDADVLKQAQPSLRPSDDVSSTVWNLYFNLSKRPFTDPRVRKAIALALDFDEVNLGGDFQGGGVRTGFVSATMRDWGWAPERAQERFKQDQERARALLAEAGFPPGQLEVLLETGRAYTQGGEVIHKQLEAVGIKAKFVPDGGSRSSPLIMSAPAFELNWGAYTGSSFFPDFWLSNTMHSRGSYNVTHLRDAKLDGMIEAQRVELDPATRKRIIDEIQDHLYETMPSVPGLAKVYYRFYSCRVKNMNRTHSNRDLEGIAHAWLNAEGC